jgi:hypothetical protein
MKFVTVAVLSLFALAPLALAKEKHADKNATSVTFKVGADAKIATATQKGAALTDLKVGDKVAIAYTEADGANTAARIKVITETKKAEGEKKEGEHKKHDADTYKHAHGAITAIDTTANTVTVEVRAGHEKHEKK